MFDERDASIWNEAPGCSWNLQNSTNESLIQGPTISSSIPTVIQSVGVRACIVFKFYIQHVYDNCQNNEC